MKPGAGTALLREVAAAPQAQGEWAWEPALRTGDVVGRFELLRELGRGGFGVVWEARDQGLGRQVAFKLVRAGRAQAGADQLHREAEAVARLQHPNLVTLHDVGHCEHGPYLVLELLRGEKRVSGGTPSYMAPEQWRDDPEDERTDAFALGVMLCQMLGCWLRTWRRGPATAARRWWSWSASPPGGRPRARWPPPRW